jgi:hypothetical protein
VGMGGSTVNARGAEAAASVGMGGSAVDARSAEVAAFEGMGGAQHSQCKGCGGN